MQDRSLLHKLTARFRKKPYWGRMLSLTGNDLEEKKWVFILGCYNSGTTLLNQLLAGHPAIGGLPDEGVMLTDQLVKPEDFGWRRMWWKCENLITESLKDKNKNSRIIKKQWSHFYPPNKEYLIEKSISNVCRIPFFEKEFQPAYFIHIVRNGYAAAEGIRRKAEIMPQNEFFGMDNYPIDLCIEQWVRSLEKVEQEKKGVKNFIEISYEDFTEDPKKTITGITEFLGLEAFPDAYFERNFSIHEKSSEIRNMNFSSFKRLSSEEISIINSIAGEYLTKYGYSLL